MNVNQTTELKDIKETSFNGKVLLHKSNSDHRWLWTLNFDWPIFSPI